MKHTPTTAAKAIRVLLERDIAKTWDQYFDRQHNANAYSATKLVQEQCNGIDYGKGGVADTPYSFRECSVAVGEAMPELFAEYWGNNELANEGESTDD